MHEMAQNISVPSNQISKYDKYSIKNMYSGILFFRNSALHMAAFSGNIEMVDLLLKSKVKVCMSTILVSVSFLVILADLCKTYLKFPHMLIKNYRLIVEFFIFSIDFSPYLHCLCKGGVGS